MKLYPDKIESVYSWYGTQHNQTGTREWIAEQFSGKENLVICIGDSWTWGDSLGTSHDAPLHNDVEARHNNFYTKLLADKLNADWLMLAWCGGTNIWMLHQYSIIKDAIRKGYYSNYKKVYVHVCFTEMFRDLRDKTFAPYSTDSFNDLTNEYFKYFILDNLDKHFPIPDTHKFSKNFWNVDVDCSGHNFVENTWQDLLFKESNIEDNKLVPVVSSIGIEPLVSFLKEKNLGTIQSQFSEMLVDIDARIDNMTKCEYNDQWDTRHPTIEGHRIWADYLYSMYKDL